MHSQLLHTTIYKSKQKLLYRESDLFLDVGLVVQKARKQGTVLVQWGLIGFYNKNSPTFANKEAYLQNVGLLINCRIQSNPSEVTVLYLVFLRFAPLILHPTNHFLN